MISDYYDLSVKIFMDMDTYRDSTHIITSTVIDPFKFYFLLELNDTTDCFLNTYFDLVVMKRREFENKVRHHPDRFTVDRIYNSMLNDIFVMRKEYLSETRLGMNIHGLRVWNNRVREELGIDNMAFFKLKSGKN